MIFHVYTNKKITETDKIELIKQSNYHDKIHHSIHNFYLKINGEDCGGVCGFEGENVELDYDADDFLFILLESEMNATLVDCIEDRYDSFNNTQAYHCMFRIDVDERHISNKIDKLRERKKIEDYRKIKAFTIGTTNKLLSKDNLIISAGYCDDYWKSDIFDISFFDAKAKFEDVFACPFDNNLITGKVHHSNDIGWGCSRRCKLPSLTKAPDIKETVLLRHLENLERDAYHKDNLSEEDGTPTLLSELELKRLELIVKKIEEEEDIEYRKQKAYEEEHKIRLIGCSDDIFKDLKYLNDNGFLTKFEDFDFEEDKIIYTYVDYDFCDEQIEITGENIWFSIMPTFNKDSYDITIGDGCCVRVTEPITDKNRDALKEFYNNCRFYQRKHSTNVSF